MKWAQQSAKVLERKQVALKLGKRGQFPTRAVHCEHCLGKATGTPEGPGGRSGLQSLRRVVIR